MDTLCIFPAELVCNILSYTDPRDIIRWRTVSKGFYALTHDTLLWKALYMNVPFPRPPGLFSPQSVKSVQRELVKSAKLAESWTTRPMRIALSAEVRVIRAAPNTPKLVGGRWLIARESEKKIVLHVNVGAATHARRVLWENENSGVRYWDATWMPPVRGKYSVYVMIALLNMEWNLLEFRLDEQSSELHDFVIIDTSSRHMWNQGFNLHGTPPFLYIPTQPRHVVFDTRTRVFHEVPEFRIMLDETRMKVDLSDYPGRITWMTLTNHHLIYFRTILASTIPRYLTLMQAFTLPLDGSSVSDDDRILRLTHEGISDAQLPTRAEVSKSSVDPITGATNVKFLDCLPGASQIMRHDLTLPKPPSFDVVPMTIETQVFHLPDHSTLMERYNPCFHYGNLFDDGHARCFYGAQAKRRGISCAADTYIMKYTIDTTQEPWVFEFGELLPDRGNPIVQNLDVDYCMFDGLRGKLSFTKCLDEESKVILVADVE